MSDALPLPPRPHLDQYKKLARDLQRACRSGETDAIHAWAVRWLQTVARLQGVEVTADRQRSIDRDATRVTQHWQALTSSHERAGRCLLADVQFFIARQHGFASWPKFAHHVEMLTRVDSPVSNFEAAVDAIVRGDAATLRQLLRDHPELAHARSTREHQSTLLHYVSANGIEDFRQQTPANIVEIATLLLDAGADVNAESEAYGGGSTALGLAATSGHPEQAGVQIALLETLLARGAVIEPSAVTDETAAAGAKERRAGGSVRSCLANGQPRAARFLAERGASLDFETAAGIGRLDLVQRAFDEHGRLHPDITPQQVASGFAYACGYDHVEVVRFLLEKGLDPATHTRDGEMGLHWAAVNAYIEVLDLLLRHGAPVDARDNVHHGTPLDWAYYGWVTTSDAAKRERGYAAVARLVRAGAAVDREWVNSLTAQHRPPDARMEAALRGELLEDSGDASHDATE